MHLTISVAQFTWPIEGDEVVQLWNLVCIEGPINEL
jgi:hypothetical protein